MYLFVILIVAGAIITAFSLLNKSTSFFNVLILIIGIASVLVGVTCLDLYFVHKILWYFTLLGKVYRALPFFMIYFTYIFIRIFKPKGEYIWIL